MSTFSGLNTAYTGLVAAKAGLDVTGQNIANAGTAGYTRQRVTTAATEAGAVAGLFSGGVLPGQGVSVTSIARLGNAVLDAAVRSTASAASFSRARASAYDVIETSLNEPGDKGLSTSLQKFWAAWQDVSNQAGDTASASALLGRASSFAGQLASIYQQVDDRWSATRDELDGQVASLNEAATALATLNGSIRSALLAGGSANELIDRRDALATQVASLIGGSVRRRDDGTVDVLVGGNALVSGDSARAVTVSGARSLSAASADPVGLSWADRPGVPLAADGGAIAGNLSLLAPAEADGTGGLLAETAASYDAFAQRLAEQVNGVHRTGVTSNGATGLDFFAFDPGKPAALGLTVVPTGSDGIAAAAPGAGAKDGSVADRIALLGSAADGPDRAWSALVVSIGSGAKTEASRSQLADLAHENAVGAQLSGASVDLDEENINLVQYQHAYQGAARVMTAVDEALDVLINHTGLVGR